MPRGERINVPRINQSEGGPPYFSPRIGIRISKQPQPYPANTKHGQARRTICIRRVSVGNRYVVCSCASCEQKLVLCEQFMLIDVDFTISGALLVKYFTNMTEER